MIRCPECNKKLKSYCTKNKKNKTIRYYKCNICGTSFKTRVFKYEVEKIISEEIWKEIKKEVSANNLSKNLKCPFSNSIFIL